MAENKQSEGALRAMVEDLLRREQEAEKKKKKKRADLDAAIAASFGEQEAKKKLMYRMTLRASQQLGNPYMGGNRLSGYYRPKVYAPDQKKEKFIQFTPESVRRKVKLSDIAMARMPTGRLS
jgi:hypothetical protein